MRRMLLACFVVHMSVFVPFVAFAQSCANPPGRIAEGAFNVVGKTITYYVPHNSEDCTNSIEGCVATSCRGLAKIGDSYAKKPTCLDAVRLGQAKYVTIASAASNYGKYYNLGTITYRSALDKQMHTVQNVIGYVHDTGCAFNGTCSAKMKAKYGFSSVPRPDKLDVCTTVCLTCNDTEAQALAQGQNVNIARSTQGANDPVQTSSGLGNLAGLGGSAFGVNPSSAYSSTGGAFGGYPSNVSTGGASVSSSQNPSTPMSVSTGGSGTANPVPTFISKGRSAGNLMVEPTRAMRGGFVRVSWSSVNMEPFSCVVKVNGADFATGNEASKPYQIPTSASGTVAFTMRCMAADGTAHESASVVSVQ